MQKSSEPNIKRGARVIEAVLVSRTRCVKVTYRSYFWYPVKVTFIVQIPAKVVCEKSEVQISTMHFVESSSHCVLSN